MGAEGEVDLDVTGVGGVPDEGVGAVVLNVTATEASAGGFVTVYPAGEDRPDASNLNFTAGQTIPNLVIAKVGEGGRVELYNDAGDTHLIADVVAGSPRTSPIHRRRPRSITENPDEPLKILP